VDIGSSFVSIVIICRSVRIHSKLMATKPLSETHPALAAEWHPTRNPDLTPDKVSAGSNKRVWWLADCGHEWDTEVKLRLRGYGCPFCAGRRILRGFNDLNTLYPELGKEWHPTKNGDLLPDNASASSHDKVWWLDEYGHEWESTINKRQQGRNCPVCVGRKVIVGVNDLASVRPDIAKEWHPTKNGDLSPTSITISSGLSVWWLGECGHEYKSRLASKTLGVGCPYCSGTKLLLGFNDLQSRHPALAAEWHPTKNGDLTPSNIHGGQPRSYWWLGKCGHEWRQLLTSRASGRGCPYCVGKKILLGFNDLATTNPEICLEWHPTKNGDFTPQEITSGSLKSVWWLGECGHEWRTNVPTRLRGSGCPTCSIGGFRSTEPATLYFLHNPRLQAFKVGITNKDKKVDRISKFVKQGWQVVNRWESESGLIIVSCETTFFQWLRRDQQIPVYLDKKTIGSIGGETETFSDSILTRQEVIAKIEELLRENP
jgi:DNA-directed RNA polymerase subunit RPC12/RpoP